MNVSAAQHQVRGYSKRPVRAAAQTTRPKSGPTYGARPHAKQPKTHTVVGMLRDIFGPNLKSCICVLVSGSVQHYLARSTQLKATYGPKVPDRFLLGQKLAAAPGYFTMLQWS